MGRLRADHHADGAFAGVGQDPRARRRRRRLRHEAFQRERADREDASDPAEGSAAERGSEVEQLSFYEVELLRLLHEKIGQPVSREEILQKVWGIEAGPSNRTVDNFIVKLRKKIEKHPDKPVHILTVYGFGYKLALTA